MNSQKLALGKFYPAFLPKTISIPFGNVSAVLNTPNYSWVSGGGASGQVCRIKKSDWSVSGAVAAENSPLEMCYTGIEVWITNYNSDSVTILNADDMSFVRRISIGLHPEGIIYDGNTKRVLIAHNGSGDGSVGMGVFDALTHATISYPTTGGNPDSFAIDDSGYIWLTCSAINAVQVFDPNTYLALFTIPVGAFPLSIINDGQGSMWVGNGAAGTLSKINITTHSVTTVTVGAGPRGLACDSDYVMVANSQNNTASYININTNAVVGTYPTGSVPRGVANDGQTTYYANSSASTVTVM